MFSLSDVLQSAADVLAPPATRLEDFEYHWKMVLNFYQSYDDSCKVHVEDTRVPYHLHKMLQLIVDEEKEQQGGTVGACLEALVQRSVFLMDFLPAMARADKPPGARALALSTATQLLRWTKQPCVNSVNVYKPLQRLLIQCNEISASPTEKEEVELLLTVCGLVRKDPGLANLFTTPYIEDKAKLMSVPEEIQRLIPMKSKVQTPKKNTLFEVELPVSPLSKISIVRTCGKDHCNASASGSAADEMGSCKSDKTVCDDNDKFLLIDLLLSYLNSADNQVVLRACEGIMIVCSLPEDDIANLVTCSPACEAVAERLAVLYRRVPASVDPNDVDHLNITWAYVAQDFGDKTYNNFLGYRELTSFFSWLDFCDTLMKECHPAIAAALARAFRQCFLEGAAETGVSNARQALVATAVLGKCLGVVDSPHLIDEFSNWLVGDGGDVSEWPLMHKLISNCDTSDYELTLQTLRFFETIIEKGHEHSIHRLVLARISSRGYLALQPPEDEERDRLNDVPLWRERESNREAMKQLQHEGHVNEQITDILTHEGLPADERGENHTNMHRVINSFLLLLPRAILSDPVGSDYEHYIHDAHRNYQLWLDMTGSFGWPTEARWADTASSTHSYDSRPEADLHLDERAEPWWQGRAEGQGQSEAEEFDEGPFLRLLLSLLAEMPSQPYQVNLHVTSLISKLALLPHPSLHEYLLEPALPTARGTRTLYKALQRAARKLTLEVPRVKNYAKIIEETRHNLTSEEPTYDDMNDGNRLIESLIVMEEFCKELAAIAFVKYQHSLHTHR